MVVRNTSRYPTDEVERLVRFGSSEIDMRRVCVNVKNSRRYACGGYAYSGVPSISNAPPGCRYLVTIRLGPPELFPTVLPGRRRSPQRLIACWREAVVAIAAHEAKHIEQFRLDRPRSEVECERFEVATVVRYRESAGVTRRASPGSR